jgi:FKBP-type peptidyl-prolyl cis-trans isomerase
MDRRTTARLLLAAAVSLSLAACGSGDGSTSSSSSGQTTAEQPTTQACETRSATTEAPAGVSTDLTVQPEIPTTDAPPPCDLEISDIVVGTGPEAVQGSTAAVKYVGGFYGTGAVFDSSWSRGADETFPVTLGAGQVIPGFEQGILGMHAGGRRMVVIPSDLGYGPNGQGPIPGGATLVFIIDLVQVS